MRRFLIALLSWTITLSRAAAFIGLGSVAILTCANNNAVLYGTPQYSCVRNWYLSPAGSDTTGNGSQAQPWSTIGKADANVSPGDCVNLAAGVYMYQNQTVLHNGGNVNSSTGYVVYRGPSPGIRPTPGDTVHTAIIRAATGGNLGNASLVFLVFGSGTPQANYVIFDGLEIDGNNNTAAGQCIGTYLPYQHHLVFENNVIHGCGTGNLGVAGAEYYWVINNLIYGGGYTNGPVEGSGVSVYEPHAAVVNNPGFTPNGADTALTWRVVIANNIIHDNTVGPTGCAYGVTQTPNTFTVSASSGNTITIAAPSWLNTTNGNFFIQDNTHNSYLIPYATITNVAGNVLTLSQTPSGSMTGDTVQIACGTNFNPGHTDQNGIVLDDWQNTQNGNTNPYTGPAIIVGNTIYNNGGACILAFETTGTNGITIANNSCYNNYTDVQNTGTNRGEINCNVCNNITLVNNAMLPVVGGSQPTSSNKGLFNSSGSGNITCTTNITTSTGGLSCTTSTGNLFSTNPGFANPTTGDLSAAPGSPMIGAATSEPWIYTTPKNCGLPYSQCGSVSPPTPPPPPPPSGGPVTFIATSGITGNQGSTTCAVTVPTTTVVGDLIAIIEDADGDGTTTALSIASLTGYSTQFNNPGAGVAGTYPRANALFYKIATAPDIGNTVTITTADTGGTLNFTFCEARIYGLVNATTPFDPHVNPVVTPGTGSLSFATIGETYQANELAVYVADFYGASSNFTSETPALSDIQTAGPITNGTRAFSGDISPSSQTGTQLLSNATGLGGGGGLAFVVEPGTSGSGSAGGGGGGGCGSAPAPAAAAGYCTQVFSYTPSGNSLAGIDTTNSHPPGGGSTLWYINKWPAAGYPPSIVCPSGTTPPAVPGASTCEIGVSGGVLTMNANTSETGGPNSNQMLLGSAFPFSGVSGGYRGIAFGCGFYVQYTAAFSTAGENAGVGSGVGSGWPTLWTEGANVLFGLSSHYAESDQLEYTVGTAGGGPVPWYSATVHDFNPGYTEDSGGAMNRITPSPAATYPNYNTYGQLYLPGTAANGWAGSFQNYFNGVHYPAADFNWVGNGSATYSSSACASGIVISPGGLCMSIADHDHFVVLMGTGIGASMFLYVTNVQVWQNPLTSCNMVN